MNKRWVFQIKVSPFSAVAEGLCSSPERTGKPGAEGVQPAPRGPHSPAGVGLPEAEAGVPLHGTWRTARRWGSRGAGPARSQQVMLMGPGGLDESGRCLRMRRRDTGRPLSQSLGKLRPSVRGPMWHRRCSSSGLPASGEVSFLRPRKAGNVIILECEPWGPCSHLQGDVGTHRGQAPKDGPRRLIPAELAASTGDCGAQTPKPRLAGSSFPRPCLTCGIFQRALGQAGSHEPGGRWACAWVRTCSPLPAAPEMPRAQGAVEMSGFSNAPLKSPSTGVFTACTRMCANPA